MNTNSKLYAVLLIILLLGSLQATPSPKIAFLKSAILPGWGQLESGSKSGLFFLTSEVLLWSTKYYYDNEADLKETASKKYAINFAGIDPEGSYNDDYFYLLTRYNSSGYESGGYNSFVYLNEPQPEDFEEEDDFEEAYQNYYAENTLISENKSWLWKSREHRHDYAILRKRIIQYGDYSQTMVGVIIANHLVSAIHAALVSRKASKFDVSVSMDNQFRPRLNCQYRF